MAKPTGDIGPTRMSVVDAGSVDVAFEKIAFPKSKDEVESFIVEDFLATVTKALASQGETFIFGNPAKNVENDFDFDVESKQGCAFLELMEIAPLELFEGGYDKVPPKYKPYDLSQIVVQKILGKAKRYSGKIGRPLFLLTYITHWGFTPSESTIALLRYLLAQAKHPFNAVFLYSPIEKGFGDPRWLYPVPPELIAGVNPEQLKDNEVLNLDPAKWQAVKSGS
ncbi:MAG TPA: hypothetical protein VFA81_02430 [Burkholderiales bacterium]|nr:hypothetical protein [Burkholderiales bacterium]